MQRRKSFFNNEMEQRFSLRKYTIGLCSVCLGFVTIGMGSQTVKADTVNNIEKSSVVQENKMQILQIRLQQSPILHQPKLRKMKQVQ